MNPSATNFSPKTSGLRHFSALLVLCAASFPLFLASHARGATVLWDSSPSTVNINDATQVSTAGTLFTAVSYWSANTAVVNGVTFLHFNTDPNFTPFTPIDGSGNNGTVPSNEYGKLIAAGAFLDAASAPSNPSVITGLTVGNQYQLQIWVPAWNSDWITQFGSVSNGTNTGNANNSPTLHMAIAPATTSQYVFGTFTADATMQNLYQFAMTPGGFSYAGISALQVRDVTPVPEPATVTLLALGGLTLALRRRFRQNRVTA